MTTDAETKYFTTAEMVRSLYRARTCTIHIYTTPEEGFPEFVTAGEAAHNGGAAADGDSDSAVTLVRAAEQTLENVADEPAAASFVPLPPEDGGAGETLVAPLDDINSGERLGHLFIAGTAATSDDGNVVTGEIAGHLVRQIGVSIAHDRALLRADHDGRHAHIRLREANHRMKNALQTVESLLSLQAGTHPEESIQRVLRDAAQRVRAIQVLYDRLSDGVGIDGVTLALDRYLHALVASLEDVYRTVQPVTWQVEIDDVPLPAEHLSSIGLIVNEVISNALLHAFEREPGSDDVSSQAPAISVTTVRNDGVLMIRVSDNGVGVPPGFEPGENAGLGTTIARLLTERLGGTLAYERRGDGEERGTVVSITLPLE